MDGETAGGPNVVKEPGRVTKEQADAKAKEATAAWSSLMDAMESSKETQGDYFLKIGTKTPEEDTRALILRQYFEQPAIDFDSAKKIFVVVTANGLRGINEYYNRGIYGILDPAKVPAIDLQVSKLEKGTGISKSPDQFDRLVIISKSTGTKEIITCNHSLLADDDIPRVNKAIEDSIKKAESPHKVNVEAAQKQIRMANSLSSFISQLPPKL